MWKSGSTTSSFSFASSSTFGSPCVSTHTWLQAVVRLPWVSMAPFGWPVVPPVYCSTASASRGSPMSWRS